MDDPYLDSNEEDIKKQFQMFFHKFVDCTGHSQDANFIYGVSITLPNVLFSYMSSCYLRCVYLVFTGNPQSCC
jgi:hypothetical protein